MADTTGEEKSVEKHLSGLEYRHVDVFSREPLSGNGLTVFPSSGGMSTDLMQKLTQEMRQFESIFLSEATPAGDFAARIFTMEEELDFAGHPVLGAACVLHEREEDAEERRTWNLRLNVGPTRVATIRHGGWYEAVMEQQAPVFGEPLGLERSAPFLEALNLVDEHIADSLPLQVVSTGLPYLIVPVSTALERAKILHPDFETLLGTVGAKFVYVLDVGAMEGRTWDNDGSVEDIATGSAAGPVGAYLVEQRLASLGERITVHQGRFVGRQSRMQVTVEGMAGRISNVRVGGEVRMVARGVFDATA